MPKTSKLEVEIDMQETQPSRIYQHFALVQTCVWMKIEMFKSRQDI